MTLKYGADGSLFWVRHYDGSVNDWDVAGAVALDALGKLYVSGWSFGTDMRQESVKDKIQLDEALVGEAGYPGGGVE